MSTSDPAELAKAIEQLANQFFAGVPGPAMEAAAPAVAVSTLTSPGALVPPGVGPHALNVGAGGASPAVTLPPVPGPLHRPPIAAAPPPKESDLRAIPTLMAENLGTPSAIAMASGSPAGDAPYFLELAGLPAAYAHEPPGAPTALDAASLRTDAFDPRVVPEVTGTKGIFDPHAVKRDFPILRERVHGRRLVWLDNAATTHKPQSVIDRLAHYYAHENSNVHRAAHALAARSTDAYEGARDKARRFLNAPSPKEIVFVRGTTEGINLVAKSWGGRHVAEGDEIVITWLEHHANIVPWQMLCAEKGARLRVAPVDERGQILLEEYEKLLSPRTRIVSFGHVSNALGTITPAREMVAMAHRHGALVHVDGAQAVSHMPVDVQALDCDFYTFSGHKVFGPTGIGVLYGKSNVLDAMPPWQGGGNMIADVTFEKTTYQPAPMKFEAGTGNIADAVGLGAALDYVESLGLENIARYEHELLGYAEEQLACVPGLHRIGTAAERAGVLSFVLDGVRTEEVGEALDREGIAVRSGHHCAQPILRRFGLESTVRASLAPYNTREDVDALASALKRLTVGRPRSHSL